MYFTFNVKNTRLSKFIKITELKNVSVFASFYIYDRKLANVDISFMVLLIRAHKANPDLKNFLEVSEAKYLLTSHHRVENFLCCFWNVIRVWPKEKKKNL